MAPSVRAWLEWRMLFSIAGAFIPVDSLSPLARPTVGFLEAGVQVAQAPGNAGFCVPLKNAGSHSSVVIGVGQPQQQFSVVADTGSSAVLVASCECENCGGGSKCYDEGKSSSYKVTAQADRIMSYGSGDAKTKVVTDTVALGQASALMTEGLLEMTDMQMNGDFPLDDFEGILGLGPPVQQSGSDGFMEKNFPTEAKIDHFSFCLRDSDATTGGVLQMGGSPSTAKQLSNIGEAHWALGFNGVSIGDGPSLRMSFCSPSDMAPGQEMPCHGIPDSGTTLISAPPSQLDELMGGICDAWPRCATAAGDTPRKNQIFLTLLSECNFWIHRGEGLDELPTLHFHVTGADGIEEPIAISPWAYVVEMPFALYQSHAKSLLGVAGMKPTPPEHHKSPMDAVMCFPAFGPLHMPSGRFGPLWIFGTSFFYEHAVHFNLSPQTIAFERGECGTCDAGTGDQFFETRANGTVARRGVRRLSSPPRTPERYKARGWVM